MTSGWLPTGGRCAPWTAAGRRTPSTPSPSPAAVPASSPCPEGAGALCRSGLAPAHRRAELFGGPVGGAVAVERRQVGTAVVPLFQQQQFGGPARLVDQAL